KGKNRAAKLGEARDKFQNIFQTSDTTWADGLAGYMEAALLLAHESADPSSEGTVLVGIQGFLDKAADTLKGRKVAQKEIGKVLKPQRDALNKEWFTLLGTWLQNRGESTDLSNQDDMTFVTTILGVAEGTPPDPSKLDALDVVTRSQIGQVHWIL